MKRLDAYWDNRNGLSLLLLPLSWLFCCIAWLRRRAYQWGLLKSHRLPVPVIVVGNITVGGTGKTPLVVWLAGHLREKGLRPGIIARGYGGDAQHWPQPVSPDSDAGAVGDEAVLMACRTGCPVYVGPDRVTAARALLDNTDCNVILSDDGMQHYALQRDIEIAVVDGIRRFGNGYCLPAGPLRELPSRLGSVDLVVANGAAALGEHLMRVSPGKVVNLHDPERVCRLEDFAGQPVHAMAGVGNPQRFFDMLRGKGLEITEHAFPDHHRYTAADLSADDGEPLLMTEKDAVKCNAFAQPRHWYVEADAELDNEFSLQLDDLLRGIKNG